MSKPLILSAFVMNTTSHILQGLWRTPEAEQTNFNDLEHWVKLAQLLEAGKFDAIFFADVIGLYGDHRGSYEPLVTQGLQIPSNDPSVIASAIAWNTSDIGIAITSSVLQEHPFNFARRLSTLDHATKGRIAWNIVTNSLQNGARNFGQDLTPHDERYAWADEYVDVTYKLWEGSWDEGALVQDRERGVHADAAKVHKIHHEGTRYHVEGPHLVAPSPQRTPVLFQAGSSEAGRDFAAKNAELQFILSPSPAKAAKLIADTRRRTVAYGRRPEDLKFVQGLHFVIGSTEEEARRKETELEENINLDAMVSHLGGALGVDLGHYSHDTPLGDVEATEGVRSIVAWVRESVEGREATVGDLGRLQGRSSRVVGTPESIADRLQEWQDAGVDGINVVNATLPGSYVDFIEHVIPVLQRRGLAKTDYEPGTLRKKLFGTDHLSERHPAAQYRGAFSDGCRPQPSATVGRAGMTATATAPVAQQHLTEDELLATFQPVFDRIREGAIDREQERRLPYEEINALREAGFGRLRVPCKDGGFGATLDQLVLLLIRLATADSNIPQALRGHIGFTEYVLAHPDQKYRQFWFRELVGGSLVGNAESERTGTFGSQVTEVTRKGDSWLLNGAKYYTTGSIFADWIYVSAARRNPETGERALVSVQVSRLDPGVVIDDDWDGFGQRTTGSGTTVFTDVVVDPRFVHERDVDAFTRTTMNAVYQLVHLAGLAGLGVAALDEIQQFLRSRSRNLFNPSVAPTNDPVALQIIGESYGVVETVTASVLAAARTVQHTTEKQLAGVVEDKDFALADAHVYGVQGTVIDLVLRLVSRIFEVGGASATAESRRLDRLWRNARTISSHNPAIYRQQAVGNFVLNGVAPGASFLSVHAEDPATATATAYRGATAPGKSQQQGRADLAK